MEAKFYIYLLLLAGVIGGTYAIYLEQQTDALRTSIEVTRQNITGVEGQLKQRARQVENRQALATLLAENAALKEEKEKMEAAVKAEKERLPEIQEGFRQAILKVRRETVGMPLPGLVLSDGSSLQEAVVQQVLEEEVVIRHAQGIRRVAAKLLPAALKDRLRPGALADTAPPAAAAPAAPPAPGPDGQTEAEAAKKEKKIQEARLAVEKMQLDLAGLNEQLRQAEDDLAAAASPSRKYYAENRRNHFRSLVQAQKDRINNAGLALSRMEAGLTAP